MTTMHQEEVSCAVCGSAQMVMELGSTNAFGSMDLDTRPPEMQRSTMGLWVHECAACGFVSEQLEEASESECEVTRSERYQAEWKRENRPRLASRFVCRALLREAEGDLLGAGWRRLHAAWACDDEEKDDEAREQRLVAVAAFEAARAAGQAVMPGARGGEELLFTDLLRRSGELGRAQACCEAGLALDEVPEFIGKCLELEHRLIEAGDTACHTVDEAE